MPNINHDTAAMRDVIRNAKVIAVVGHSDDPARASYQVASYLRRQGYTVYPVNPTVDEIDGQRSYASLTEIPEPIDIVDIFRRSEFLPEVIEEAVAAGAGTVWAQLGLHHDEAERVAVEAGLNYVSNYCLKVEHARLR
jgi:uncharacterized protein